MIPVFLVNGRLSVRNIPLNNHLDITKVREFLQLISELALEHICGCNRHFHQSVFLVQWD